MELDEASPATGSEMGECSISPRVLRLDEDEDEDEDEANVGRALGLSERLSSPRVFQYLQFEDGFRTNVWSWANVRVVGQVIEISPAICPMKPPPLDLLETITVLC